LRKLDELMWTFLRMLTIEEALDRFLETERRDDVPRLGKDGEGELAALTADLEALKRQKADPGIIESKQRLISSRLERLEVLRKRLQRIEQAQGNLRLVVSEQERLEQQIKLVRADAIARKSAETLTARIDATVEHLDQTNQWLAEMDEFQDLVGELPVTPVRVGYEPRVSAVGGAMPPKLPQEQLRMKT
jgi:DNA repair exonuclease SbcCD ATPase subunit